jgi:malonyl-CoA O-methyltransferase
LGELKAAWSIVDSRQHVNTFFLKEAYQSAAIAAGFHIHLLEQEPHVLQYDRVTELMRELKALGAHNLNAQRASALMGRQKLASLTSAYEAYRDSQGRLPASYELIWGVLEKPCDYV